MTLMQYLQYIFNLVQYLFIRLAMLLYGLVPASKAYNLGFNIASCVYPLFKIRQQIAIDNILKAKITESETEAARIARHSFCHFMGHIFEALKVPQVINETNWKEHIVYDTNDVENWNTLMVNLDIPIMLLTGHLGSWEVAVTIVPFTRPMMPVGREMNNPMLARFLKKSQFRGQCHSHFKEKRIYGWHHASMEINQSGTHHCHGPARRERRYKD